MSEARAVARLNGRIAIESLQRKLASGQRVTSPPFIETPRNAWVRVFDDGSFGGEYWSRSNARFWAKNSMKPGRVTKARTLYWLGQPMRVKGGPEIKRLSDLKRKGGKVYTIGNSRNRLNVLISEVTPYMGMSLRHVLFKGAIWPFAHTAE